MKTMKKIVCALMTLVLLLSSVPAVFADEADTKTMLYTQLFQQLYRKANFEHGGRLPVHVHFVIDEFANGTQL